MSNQTAKPANVRYMAVTAMLSAIAFILMYLEFSIPIMPSFIKLDLSDLPELIGSFAMGPGWGVLICLIKNLLHAPFTQTGCVGELSNFILGASFVFPAGMIYQHKKNRVNAIVGSLTGAVAMAVISVPANYFIVYPVYTRFMPMDVIISMYQAIYSVSDKLLRGLLTFNTGPLTDMLSSLFSLLYPDTLLKCLLIFNMPFTFFKGIVSVVITFVVYKRISPLIKGTSRRH